ncbi:MAG: hypothetical protein ACFFBD_22575 [Candidatus Hodarchaeota archaeon]
MGELIVQEQEMNVEVLENRTERAQQVKFGLENAVQDLAKNFYDICVYLAESCDQGYPKMWGYDSFDQYVEDVLKFSRRKAYDFRNAGRAILKAGLTREQAIKIGSTKLSDIAPILIGYHTDKALEEAEKRDLSLKLLTDAEQMSCRDLEMHLRTIKDEKSQERTIPERDESPMIYEIKKLRFDGEQGKIVESAMKTAYAEIGKHKTEDAIAYICSQWMMAQQHSADEMGIGDWVNYLHESYGIQLQIIDDEESIDSVLEFSSEEERLMDEDLQDILGADDDSENLLRESLKV